MDLSAISILIKTTVTHTVTYFVVGLVVFKVFDYPHLLEETGFRYFMRPTTDLKGEGWHAISATQRSNNGDCLRHPQTNVFYTE